MLKSGAVVVDAAMVAIAALRDFWRCVCAIPDGGADVGLCICWFRDGLPVMTEPFGATPLPSNVVAEALRQYGDGMGD